MLRNEFYPKQLKPLRGGGVAVLTGMALAIGPLWHSLNSDRAIDSNPSDAHTFGVMVLLIGAGI